MDYERICFVVMPYGNRVIPWLAPPRWSIVLLGSSLRLGGRSHRNVDFDYVYDHVFAPAIAATGLPEGGTLEPKRADRATVTGLATQSMALFVQFSRFVLADLSGASPNVMYELGHRHSACASGTAVFRLPGALIPFDIATVQVFPYEYEPEDVLAPTRAKITEIIGNSLRETPLDSPIHQALRALRAAGPELESLLIEAHQARLTRCTEDAIAAIKRALQLVPGNGLLHLELGLLYRDNGRLTEALEETDKAVTALPNHVDAYRQKGLIELTRFDKLGRPDGIPTGEGSLRRAVELRENDVGALSGLAAALSERGDLADALKAYAAADALAPETPSHLIGRIVTHAGITGNIVIDRDTSVRLRATERCLKLQIGRGRQAIEPGPALDLAQVRLLAGDERQFLRLVDSAIAAPASGASVMALQRNLRILSGGGVKIRGLDEGLDLLSTKLP
jgi:tetratricopeptide (TPR) repeat protein